MMIKKREWPLLDGYLSKVEVQNVVTNRPFQGKKRSLRYEGPNGIRTHVARIRILSLIYVQSVHYDNQLHYGTEGTTPKRAKNEGMEKAITSRASVGCVVSHGQRRGGLPGW